MIQLQKAMNFIKQKVTTSLTVNKSRVRKLINKHQERATPVGALPKVKMLARSQQSRNQMKMDLRMKAPIIAVSFQEGILLMESVTKMISDFQN